jgi:hypothetical protein
MVCLDFLVNVLLHVFFWSLVISLNCGYLLLISARQDREKQTRVLNCNRPREWDSAFKSSSQWRPYEDFQSGRSQTDADGHHRTTPFRRAETF